MVQQVLAIIVFIYCTAPATCTLLRKKQGYNSKALLSPWPCPLVDYSSLVQRNPQECLGSAWNVNHFDCYRGELIFLIWPLKPSGVTPKGSNTLIKGHTMLLSTLHLRPPILLRLPMCCTLPPPVLQCLKVTHEKRPFIFATCSIPCIQTSPWGKCGLDIMSSQLLLPGALFSYPVSSLSDLFAWGSSVTHEDPNGFTHPVLQDPGVV